MLRIPPEATTLNTTKQQDIKFVEWSNDESENSFDLRFLIAHIETSKARKPQLMDIGGGNGKCAEVTSRALAESHVDVIDVSPLAREHFTRSPSCSLMFGDFLSLPFSKKYDFIIMRTVLHHMVGRTERESLDRQIATLQKAKGLLVPGGSIFITENFYVPLVGADTTGRLIFELTKLQTVARVTRLLGANTAGEGVRFRSKAAWDSMLSDVGLEQVDELTSDTWGQTMPLWQKVPLLCRGRFQRIVRCVVRSSAPPS